MVFVCLCSSPFALTLTLTLIPLPALHANSSRTPITDSLWRAPTQDALIPGLRPLGLAPGYKHSAPLGLVLSSLSHPFGLAVCNCLCICLCNWSKSFALTLTLTLHLLPSRCPIPLPRIIHHQHPVLPIFRRGECLRAFSFYTPARRCLAVTRTVPPHVLGVTRDRAEVNAYRFILRKVDHRIAAILVPGGGDILVIVLGEARLDQTLITNA